MPGIIMVGMTAVDATLPALPQKRRAMLLVLRRLGEARAEDLADALDVTVSAARQHLQALVAAGLVGHREERGRPGRPRHVYHVQPAADAYFPKAYDDLSRELLELVREEDPVLLARIFERRRRRRVERARARRRRGRPCAPARARRGECDGARRCAAAGRDPRRRRATAPRG
jgi:DeoR family suf operon transcriptional repressor